MSYVKTFEDYTPVARFDNTPWTVAKVDEASVSAGPWVEIASFDLAADPDPRNPQARDFTVTTATLRDGWYRIRFLDAGGNQEQTDPVSSTPFAGTPTVSQVAALILSRTTEAGGREAGTFTEHTKPTYAQTLDLIQQSVEDTWPLIGDEIPDAKGANPDALREAVTAAISYHAAELVEQTYYSEQVMRGTSPYTELHNQWEESIKRVQGAIESAGVDTPSGADGGSMRAKFGFPADAGGMVGWGTNW